MAEQVELVEVVLVPEGVDEEGRLVFRVVDIREVEAEPAEAL